MIKFILRDKDRKILSEGTIDQVTEETFSNTTTCEYSTDCDDWQSIFIPSSVRLFISTMLKLKGRKV